MNNNFFLLTLVLANTTYADYESLNINQSVDRLEQISRVLSTGSSVITKTLLPEESTSQIPEESKSKYIVLSSEEYRKLGKKTDYNDSKIVIDTIDYDVVEFKDFPNNIQLLNGLVKNASHIADMNLDDPYEHSWQIVCDIDHITDEKICILWKYELMISKSSRSGTKLNISKDLEELNYKTNHFIRIDKNPVHTTKLNFTGTRAIKIIDEMKKGNMAYTRFREWGGQYEENISLRGFTIAYNHMNLMYSKLK